MVALPSYLAATASLSGAVSALVSGAVAYGIRKQQLIGLEQRLHELEVALVGKAERGDIADDIARLQAAIDRLQDRLDRILERLSGAHAG